VAIRVPVPPSGRWQAWIEQTDGLARAGVKCRERVKVRACDPNDPNGCFATVEVPLECDEEGS